MISVTIEFLDGGGKNSKWRLDLFDELGHKKAVEAIDFERRSTNHVFEMSMIGNDCFDILRFSLFTILCCYVWKLLSL